MKLALWFAIDAVVSGAAGFLGCWLFKGRAIAFLQHERDHLKASAIRAVGKL
jgi:hypothetical protein